MPPRRNGGDDVMAARNKQLQHVVPTQRIDPAQAEQPRSWPVLARAAFIAIVAFLIYLPSLNGEFILDDDKYLTDNAVIRSPDGWYRIWFTNEALDYYPVSNTALWLEWRLWGTHPMGYHVTNLLTHVAAALLIWAVLRKLAIPGAFLAALLFAVHPVNVENVAWIAQRKSLLAMLFFLLSIQSYLQAEELRFAEDENRRGVAGKARGIAGLGRWYWLSFLAFVLAMLSKGSVAMLPLVLLLIVYWQRRRISWRDVLRIAPFFVVAAILTAVNIWYQTLSLHESARRGVQRAIGWGRSRRRGFICAKAMAPINLVFVYPMWHIEIHDPRWWLPLLGGIDCDARALAAAPFAGRKLGAVAVVRLGILLRDAGAGAGVHRRGLYATFVSGRPLSVHGVGRRRGASGGRLERVAPARTRSAPCGGHRCRRGNAVRMGIVNLESEPPLQQSSYAVSDNAGEESEFLASAQ